jgi:hypothetical protein
VNEAAQLFNLNEQQLTGKYNLSHDGCDVFFFHVVLSSFNVFCVAEF